MITRKKSRRSGPGGKNKPGPSLLIRLQDPARKKRWQAAADRERRTLSDWARVTLDDASTK